MPELPDLQVFSKNLTRLLAGKKVSKTSLGPVKRTNTTAAQLQKSLKGQVLKKIVREGKELRIIFKDGTVLGLHLMLRGELFYDEKKTAHKSAMLTLSFDDGTSFVMTDYQRQATPTLNPEETDVADALSKKVNAAFLKAGFARTNAVVKVWLMDQHEIRGIGNAYADEILWKAKLSPFSKCKKIPPKKVTALAAAIKKVLTDAEKKIIKSDPDIISGEVRYFLVIHNHRKKASPTGATIKVKTIGGRKTYFTDEQELFE